MAVDRRSDVHRNGCGDAADSGIPGVFGRLVIFLKRAAKNQVHGSLRVGGGVNDEPVIFFQSGNPKRLSREFDLSERQAYRYLEEAQKLDRPGSPERPYKT